LITTKTTTGLITSQRFANAATLTTTGINMLITGSTGAKQNTLTVNSFSAMPAYSFKERFVPFVLDGTKPHTIRNFRKHPVFRGNVLYLYYGMRTKHCRKLRQEICTNSQTIAIGSTGTVLILDRPFISEKERSRLKILMQNRGFRVTDELWGIAGRSLNELEKDQLAWRDGFRPDGTSFEQPTGSFDLMLRFWKSTHELPFVGNIIHWAPVKAIIVADWHGDRNTHTGKIHLNK
jgi:hypothetical protein